MKWRPNRATGWVESKDGLKWFWRKDAEDYLAFEDHEKFLWPFFASLVPPDGVFIDVGAHVGHYAVRVGRQCAKVYAVEVNPETLTVLRKNIDVNGLTSVVEVVPYAASDRAHYVSLEDPHGSVAGGSTRIVGPQVGRFPADRLDDLINPLRVDLMKIDVEGHEAHVLAGASEILMDHRPFLLIEMHHKMYGLDIYMGVLSQLSAHDYEYEVIADNRDVEYWLCSPAEKSEYPADS